jgi:hypothetical protein
VAHTAVWHACILIIYVKNLRAWNSYVLSMCDDRNSCMLHYTDTAYSNTQSEPELPVKVE